MLSSLLLLLVNQGAAATPSSKAPAKVAPIELYRRYVVGEKLAYAVKASYTDEERVGTMITFNPSDVQQAYNFTIDVLKLKNDGFVDARYRRPNLKYTIGDTVDSGPVSKVYQLDYNLLMTLSPLNEPTNVIDQTPKKKDPKAATRATAALLMGAARKQADSTILALLGQFAGEIQSLSFFTGSFDSALDLSPKLPVEPVVPGDTWKSTVGYAPQVLKGEAKRQETQRLDYIYTYVGIVPSGKTKVHRVVSKLSLKTDIADFGKQLAGGRSEIFTKAPITLDAQITYDLDLKTRHTIRAIANSKNTVQLYVKGFSAPYQESRATGTTTLSLLSRTVGPTKRTAR